MVLEYEYSTSKLRYCPYSYQLLSKTLVQIAQRVQVRAGIGAIDEETRKMMRVPQKLEKEKCKYSAYLSIRSELRITDRT